ncbi:MAG: cytochrome c oxidase accessory protein CcoG [Spirochaetia bacterium]|nr:cytochrome c oxidase accessory protein CcoG [Spirochaetia bacterium]
MIVARNVTGLISRARSWVRLVLLFVYLVTPWVNWGGRPFVLLDIADRKFYFPGIVIWPQEFYFLLFLLIIAGLSLFMFTALFGRLWCGWGCPQTIYTELFDTVGRLILPSKFGKKSEKLWHRGIVHVVWILLSAILTFHFIGYFVGVRKMAAELMTDGLVIFTNSTWPWFWVVVTGLFYFDLGMFREQFCVYVCPYARFQSVMLDRNSVIVGYDSKRGEPRRAKGADAQNGDCTNCTLCTLVCPTGIDIRDGMQVACINCGHCIDACTGEMARHGKETLVGYGSMAYFEEREKTKVLRPRTVVYGTLYVAIFAAFIFLLDRRVPANLSVRRDRNIPPVLVDGYVQNYYEVDLANFSEVPARFKLDAKILDDHSDLGALETLAAENPAVVEPNHLQPLRLVLRGKPVEQPLDKTASGAAGVKPSSNKDDGAAKHAKRTLRVELSAQVIDHPELIVKKTSIFTVPES